MTRILRVKKREEEEGKIGMIVKLVEYRELNFEVGDLSSLSFEHGVPV